MKRLLTDDDYSTIVQRDDSKGNGTHIDYESLKPLPQMIPSNSTGDLYKKYQPYLYINNGCHAYTAVDLHGQLSSGVAVSDSASDSKVCSDPKMGQVYVRSGKYKKTFAIMYAWYFPRDRTWVAGMHNSAGHRFDWENVVVYLSSSKPNAKVIGVSPSAHGGYKKYTADVFHFHDKTHPMVGYGQPADHVRNHQLLKADSGELGTLQPMVSWEMMNDQMRAAMNLPGAFDGCTSGVRDQDFGRFLEMAYLDPNAA